MKREISRFICALICCAPIITSAQTSEKITSPANLYKEGRYLFEQKNYAAATASLKAFVKQVREDGKVDLILQKPGFEKIDDFSKTLLDYIKAHGGRINLNDKSPAEDIYDTFGVSKKTFKKGVGDLYKKCLITLHEDGIVWADS